MSLNKFTVFCAHRSGSNFLEQLIIQNFYDIDSFQGKHTESRWKHAEYFSKYKDGVAFNCLIARRPIKWVNSCINFNADMWKWWGVDVDITKKCEFCFEYKDRVISIPKMITKWNRYYNNWLDNSDCYFVWYSDLLEEQARTNIVNYFSENYNLSRKTVQIAVPAKVQHSAVYTKNKAINEKNLDIAPNLTENQINYIYDNIDKRLIKKMSESRQYENSGSIQWRASVVC